MSKPLLIEVKGKAIVVDPGSGVFDHEPPPGSGMTYLAKAMMAEHLDLSKCYDYNAPSIHAGDPSTFKGPMLPPGPLKLIEHHCPSDDK